MNKMYEILEECLVEIEQGTDVDTVLFRYPEYAQELRPMLEASIQAQDIAAPEPSLAMVHINRTKILQHAAELREAKLKRSSRVWFASLRRMTVTFIVVIALFASGNGLVRASYNTLPGDNLYPVKRTWEDLLLLFTFNTQQREELEYEHEGERLEELNELIAEGRAARVDFAGYVTQQNGNEWRVSAITVLINSQTDLPDTLVTVGDSVRIVGLTQSDKTVLAERIEILPAGSKLPEVQDEEEELHEQPTPQIDSGSNSGSGSESPQIGETSTPESVPDSQEPETNESEPQESETPVAIPTPQATQTQKSEFEIRSESFQGTIQSIKGGTWVVNGRSMNVSSAEIHGNPAVGASAKVEGYYNSSGVFIAKNIEITGGSSGSHNESTNAEPTNTNDHEHSEDNEHD